MVANATHEPPGEGRQIKMKDKQICQGTPSNQGTRRQLKSAFSSKETDF